VDSSYRQTRLLLIAITLALLLQLIALAYSFTRRAGSPITNLSPNEPRGQYLGVKNARWMWMRLGPNWPQPFAQPKQSVPLSGIMFLRAPGIFQILTIQMAWTIVPTLALLAWPFSQLARQRRERLRAKEGQCPQCGYDLRVEADLCPECGLQLGDDVLRALREHRRAYELANTPPPTGC
jgi:hypothetical protein